jgi:hypothetical protein
LLRIALQRHVVKEHLMVVDKARFGQLPEIDKTAKLQSQSMRTLQ